MKRSINFFILATLWALAAISCPADPTLVTIQQPDGGVVTIQLIGDEYFHYTTTADGYTIVMNDRNGAYEYAIIDGNRLKPSGVTAHDSGARNDSEVKLLSSIGRHILSVQEKTAGQARRVGAMERRRQEPAINYNAFKGLVVLINYSDKKFGMENPNEFYSQMLNQRGYTGFEFGGKFQECPGSACDYFSDNSNGIFEPQFDVIGPVEANYSCLDGRDKSWEIFNSVLDQIDSEVDFTQYDADDDGEVDMVFFMVAGYSSNYAGNNQNYLWPHMSSLSGYHEHEWQFPAHDNLLMGKYACSSEIYGWERYGDTMPMGIGTFCHEFSHVLGLHDLYDTDGEGSGGLSNHPDRWSVMAKGSTLNYGRTPVAYTIYERYALGFSHPQEIIDPGKYTLNYVGTTGEGFILRSPVEGEFFMLDNRQQVKWDSQLPHHGLTVWRVDSTDVRAWINNRVNVKPSHNHLELVRAGGSTSTYPRFDPFPGLGNVTELSALTTPALVTWKGIPVEKTIKNITEADGVITFTVLDGVVGPITGDINNDGEINIADVNALLNLILSGNPPADGKADVNLDNELNIADVNALIQIILSL